MRQPPSPTPSPHPPLLRSLRAAPWSPPPPPATPEKAAAKFREYELGFVHMDVKHLPELRAAGGEWRKRFLFVAIDRRSRSVHLAAKDRSEEPRVGEACRSRWSPHH